MREFKINEIVVSEHYGFGKVAHIEPIEGLVSVLFDSRTYTVFTEDGEWAHNDAEHKRSIKHTTEGVDLIADERVIEKKDSDFDRSGKAAAEFGRTAHDAVSLIVQSSEIGRDEELRRLCWIQAFAMNHLLVCDEDYRAIVADKALAQYDKRFTPNK